MAGRAFPADAETRPGGVRRLRAAGALTAALAGLLLLPAPGRALVVTVGTPTASFGTSMSLSSCSSCTQYQIAAPGYPLSVPAAGHILRWRVMGRGPLALRVLRSGGGGLTAVSASAAAGFTSNGPATFATDLPVAAGDQIGVDLLPTKGPVAQLHFAPLAGSSFGQTSPAVPEGAAVSTGWSTPGALSLNADVAIAPVAASLDVATGPIAGGTAVAVTGTFLDGATSVTFGGAPATNLTLDAAGRLLLRTPPRPAAGQVDVVVHGPGGDSTLFGAFTYTTPAPSGSPPASGPGPTPPGGRAPPAISPLSLSPSAFFAARAGPSLATATGARLSYTVVPAATTRFEVSQLVAGRLVPGRGGVGHYCRPARLPVPAAARCTRYVPLTPAFSHHDRSGRNVLRLTGRLGGRALKPGSYRLTAIATDALGDRSAPVTHAFRILAPRG